MSKEAIKKITGEISLYNLQDGTGGGEGRGIDRIRTFYQWSTKTTLPLEDDELQPGIGTTFIIEENALKAKYQDLDASLVCDLKTILNIKYNGKLWKLAASDGIIYPFTGWLENEIPPKPEGNYHLWTLLVFEYTDNSESTYSLIPPGQDGQPGAPGKDGNELDIRLNFEEIVKFYNDETKNFDYSPSILQISAISNKDLIDFDYENCKFSIEINLITDAGIWGAIPAELKENGRAYYVNVANALSAISTAEHAALRVSLLEKETGNILIQKLIGIQYGSSEDMAKLALKANGLVQAVYGTKLQFNADGLKMINNDNKIVFYADEQGDLTLTGTINATAGEFSGSLKSVTGQIGGFALTNNFMFTDYAGRIESTSIDEIKMNSPLVIDGQNGKIIANDIVLGTGATIKEYLVLKDENNYEIKLANPISNNNNFISIGKILNDTDKEPYEIFTLNRDGLLRIKNQQDSISLGFDNQNYPYLAIKGTGSYIEGTNFRITPDYANFSNINCSGKISTIVFEKNKVQSVGGSMIFKTAFKIDTIYEEENYLILELDADVPKQDEPPLISGGFRIWLINNDGAVAKSYCLGEDENTDGKVLKLLKSKSESWSDYENWKSIIVIGADSDLAIGLNSSTVSISEPTILGEENSIFYPQGLTMHSIQQARDGKMPFLFLGNLNSLNRTSEGIIGYGLYASQVYLNGSLTTKIVDEENYAGVNTLSSVDATIFKDKDIKQIKSEEGLIADTSKIIFWGGAKGNAKADIQIAPFQVTQAGSIYAQNAFFEDSVFAGGTISSAEIHTAKIIGKGKNEKEEDIGGLEIYDTSGGIKFMASDDSTVPTLNINHKGFSVKNKNFVTIGTADEIKIEADVVCTDSITTSSTKLELQGQQISLKSGSSVPLFVEQNKVVIEGVLSLSTKMKYEPVSNGYDLYIGVKKEE